MTWNGPDPASRPRRWTCGLIYQCKLQADHMVGCQVFRPLKLWYFVWHVLKTKTTAAAVGIGKFVWPDIDDIYSVEILRFEQILPKPQIKDGQALVNLSERKKLRYKVQSNEYYTWNGIRIWMYCSLWTDKLVNRGLNVYVLFYYNNNHTRNSVTMSCNSVTEPNLLIANNQCMYHDKTFSIA